MYTSTAVDICYDCIKFWTWDCCPVKKEKPIRTIRVLQCSDFKPFPVEREVDLDREFISDKLMALGANPANVGFRCLVEAVMLASADRSFLYGGMTKRLYPKVASRIEVTPESVSQCIRAEISRLLKNGDTVLVKIGFGMPLPKINNSSFIAALTTYMIKQYDLQNSLKRGAVL